LSRNQYISFFEKFRPEAEFFVLRNSSTYSKICFAHATVAHPVEQHIRNVQVAGSTPASGSREPGMDCHAWFFFFIKPHSSF
jgi:hypothetical protein